MASNTISRRVFEFMHRYPPFSLLAADRLLSLSEQVEIRYFDADQEIFREGDEAGSFVFLVRKGSVSLQKQETLADVCDEGDIFGVRSMLSGKPYVLTAITREESLLYAVPIVALKYELENNPQVALFFASGLASGQSVVRDDQPQEEAEAHRLHLSFSGQQDTFHLFRLSEIMDQQSPDKLVCCSADCSIQEAARMMKQARVGSILVIDDEKRPSGIVTDTDFRERVVTGEIAISEKISRIMSSPVVTASSQSSVAEVQIMMLQRKVHHLCLTRDATDRSPAEGIITNHDLLLLQASNASVLIKQINKAREVEKLAYLRDKAEEMLRQYMRQEVLIRLICEMITAVNDALIHRAIQMAEAELASSGLQAPGLRFCWLSLGSEGRKEQLLRTDQDNALIYEEPTEDAEAAQQYFLKLARQVNDILIRCGFEKCPADIMAGNPNWCQPVSGWQQHFSQWINEPDPKAIMHATIFFDFRPAYGDERLSDDLWHFIQRQLEAQDLFMRYFANNALLNPPPLSFFRNFVVEKSGENKDQFDIKRRAMMPLSDAARVLCYERGIKDVVSTVERYEALAAHDQKRSRIFRDAAAAYDLLLQLRTGAGLKYHHSGRYIFPGELNKIQRQSLRTVFETIGQVQEILRHHFQLDYLRR